MPVLAKGKGNVLIKCKSTFEHDPIYLLSTAVITSKDKLIIHGQKHVQKLDFNKWKIFIGKRGHTGKNLAKNMTNAYLLEVEEIKK